MTGLRPLLQFAVLPVFLALAACGTSGSPSTAPVVSAPTTARTGYDGSGTSASSSNYYTYRAPVRAPAEDLGGYKVGNPYQVAGLWYHPREDFGLVETGTASWYGPNFHGRSTANGESYDMNALTAAHPTLQMPSVVRVTNLDNGRSVVVRVNDRGPFARNRIIDLSKRAAEKIGMIGPGTAEVRVEVLPEESRRIAELARSGAGTSRLDEFLARRHGGEPAMQQVAYQSPARPASIFVQVGAFSVRENADRLQTELARFGDARVDRADVNGRAVYRVRLGPLGSVESAQKTLSTLTGSGYAVAQLVVD